MFLIALRSQIGFCIALRKIRCLRDQENNSVVQLEMKKKTPGGIIPGEFSWEEEGVIFCRGELESNQYRTLYHDKHDMHYENDVKLNQSHRLLKIPL